MVNETLSILPHRNESLDDNTIPVPNVSAAISGGSWYASTNSRWELQNFSVAKEPTPLSLRPCAGRTSDVIVISAVRMFSPGLCSRYGNNPIITQPEFVDVSSDTAAHCWGSNSTRPFKSAPWAGCLSLVSRAGS